MRTLRVSFLFVVFVLLQASCARRGTITGGTKDTIAPVLEMSFPPNFSTGFKGHEFKLVFDEYVKLKNVNKQLIVSPPLKYQPEILPQSASKTITVKIKDTLAPDATYSFNFGQSIQDNNEGNPYPQLKYVFSTGNYLDSLKLRGTVKDAFDRDVEHFVSVMLYEANDKYSDSLVYKQNPRYITNTLDSLKVWEIDNLKPGKYMLVAVKDRNNNFRFDPATEKIGFQKQVITVPSDTLYQLELFRERLPFKALKPTIASGNRFYMGFHGDPTKITAEIRNGSALLPAIVTKVSQKDSVNIWYKPVKADSLRVSVKNGDYAEDFMVKIKEAKRDTLSFSAKQGGTLALRDVFTLTASKPLTDIRKDLISLRKKDSSAIDFTTDYDVFEQTLKVDFQKEPETKYMLTFLPGALTDYTGKSNDTLHYGFSTKAATEYGNLRVTLQNVQRYPIIVQLTDEKGKLLAESYSEKDEVVEFNALEPNKYVLRVIYDDNRNKTWDTGNFLEKRQSEEVEYFPTPIDVRANWDVDQTFTLP